MIPPCAVATRRRATVLLLAAAALGLLANAGPVRAADPIMGLTEVRQGMRCEALTVTRGTVPVAFDVEVLDVVGASQADEPGPRILVRASGAAVAGTGVAHGFSGAPVYCPDAAGVRRVAGAISAAAGDADSLLVYATPIEEMLGERPEAPGARASGPPPRALALPLTVSGGSPALNGALERAARRAGVPLVAAPAAPRGGARTGPLRPGSSIAVGYSGGDIALSAVGTLTYIDGTAVWGLGHSFEGAGARSLLLQDAYVYSVLAGSRSEDGGGPFKLAAPTDTIGTISNDTESGVVGRLGGGPPTFPLRSVASDEDRGRRSTTAARVVDEGTLGNPGGASPYDVMLGTAFVQSAVQATNAMPARMTTRMCLRIDVHGVERPARFCNRYVPDVGSGIGFPPGSGLEAPLGDLVVTAQTIDAFPRSPGIERIELRTRLERGLRLARMVSARAPRSVRRGSRFTVRLRIREEGGRVRTVRVRVRAPRRRGSRVLTLTGTRPDSVAGGDAFGFDLLFDEEEAGLEPPGSRAEMVADIRNLAVFDGIRARWGPRGSGPAVHTDPDVRISGRARVRVRVR